MGNYTLDSRVWVCSFTRQPEGQETVIGRLDAAVFLVLPSEAVELLDDLAQGKTIREAQYIYEEKYQETPDIEDLLNVLEVQGFVQSIAAGRITEAHSIASSQGKSKPIRYHFANFPQSLAQQIFSRKALLVYGGIIGLGCLAAVLDPSVIPTWKAYFFQENLTLMRLVLTLTSYLTLFLHEMAHLIAARAIGVSSRMGISHRLWFLVAETDMTGVWSVPRQQRYLPFLAGMLLDATSAAILILLLFAQHQGWLRLPAFWIQLSQAIVLTYLMSLLWQCYLFVRTDFYFVIANLFRCKNLMKDTETWLRNQVAKLLRTKKRVNQSHIPPSERRVIRWYAVLWLTGRIAALSALILITIPLTWHYALEIFAVLKQGYASDPYAFTDASLMLVIVFAPQGLGFWLWIRSLLISRRLHA